MNLIYLPPKESGAKPEAFNASRQITIVGANGTGKTRFMNRMIELCGEKSYVLSALNAITPSASDTPTREGSVADIYTREIHHADQRASMTDLDRLGALLFQDEFRYLLTLKTEKILYGNDIKFRPTKLDRLVSIWQRIFPDNQVIREYGNFMFATPSGDNLISTAKLSSGEKTVLYYIAAVLYAMTDAVIFVDSPTIFLHPSLLNTLWNAIEGLRPDCTFIYNTNDDEFVRSRTDNICIWVKGHDIDSMTWNYEMLYPGTLPDEVFVDLIGARRPVLFIEGDARNSLDAKLYPLVFTDHNVRPLGSCNKVIEATRSFNDLKPMHHLDSHGIVDRDRRTEPEVEYLRNKHILVPDVAEIENIFLLEEIIRTMAKRRGKNPDNVFNKVKTTIIRLFVSMYKQQALLHTRHTMKRELECRADAKVKSIRQLEEHLQSLPDIIDVRGTYNSLVNRFEHLIKTEDYAEILKVFNFKPMLPESNVAQYLGYKRKEDYISGILVTLKGYGPDAQRIRHSIRRCFGLNDTTLACEADKK